MKKLLTEKQRNILIELHRKPGSYLRKSLTNDNTEKYKFFDIENNPVAWFAKREVFELQQMNFIKFNQIGKGFLNEDQYNSYFKLKPKQ